ncbi:MAG: 3-hydroxyacyl-CoA dehydrogenase family protein, partial [Actinomycetes bacterium]
GLGTMGAGISEVLARAGLSVTAVDVDEEAVARGRGHLEQSTGRAVSRGKLETAERDEILGRIRFSTSLEDLAHAELVIEAVPERMELKTEIFGKLDAICPPDTILATNTSSLSVTELSVATARPSRVIGMHFFNPAPVMKLVEVVQTISTAPEVAATGREFAHALGKVPVTCGDRAGFIVNALLFPYLNDAVKMLEAHYATIDDIDLAMTKGCGHPMGPFALMDVVGLDVTLAIQQTLFNEFREPGDSPAPMLEHLVRAGYLGRKTGRGFRDYAKK